MKYITMLLLLLSSAALFAQERSETGIIYGKDHAFALTAPEGWVLDNQAGVSQGLHAVFYKEGDSWKDGETVMYANTTSLAEGPDTTIQQLIQSDMNNFLEHFPDLETTDAAAIITQDSTEAVIKYIYSKKYGQNEAIAYIQSGKVGVMLVLTSRTKDGFLSSLSAFRELVESYFFLAGTVIIKNP